ncbi:MAG: hypothetical protein RXQ96_08190 [Thermocladium sp.]
MDTERILLVALVIALAAMIVLYINLYAETRIAYNQLSYEYSRLESAYASLYSSYTQVSISLNTLSNLYAGFNRTYLNLTNKLMVESAQLNYCRANLTQSLNNNTVLAQEINSYKETVSLLTNRNESLTTELSNIISANSALKLNNSLLSQKISQLNNTLNSLNSSYNQIKYEYKIASTYMALYGNLTNGVSCNLTLIPQANNATLIGSGTISQATRNQMLNWEQTQSPQVYVLLVIPNHAGPLIAFNTVLNIGNNSWSLATIIPTSTASNSVTVTSSINAYIKTLTIHSTLEEGSKNLAVIVIAPGSGALSLLNAAGLESQTCILYVK